MKSTFTNDESTGIFSKSNAVQPLMLYCRWESKSRSFAVQLTITSLKDVSFRTYTSYGELPKNGNSSLTSDTLTITDADPVSWGSPLSIAMTVRLYISTVSRSNLAPTSTDITPVVPWIRNLSDPPFSMKNVVSLFGGVPSSSKADIVVTLRSMIKINQINPYSYNIKTPFKAKGRQIKDQY